MANTEPSLSDPAPDAAWELWYRDTFDRECPPNCEVRGRGLTRGLVELWTRHLFETVKIGGRRGFSRFHLSSGKGRIVIEGPWQGAVRLRQWIWSTESSKQGAIAEADHGILQRIAAAHAALHLAGQTSEPILAAAVASIDKQEFEDNLARLIDGHR